MKYILSLKNFFFRSACLLMAVAVFCVVTLTNSPNAYAESLTLFTASTPLAAYWTAPVLAKQPDVLTQLKAEFMPQLYEILTPEQEAMFEEAISGGTSFRRTFKNLMLTPEQKREIKQVLNSVPKRDLFASLTPTQKKGLFLKKKEAFMPSSDEIIERINDKMPAGASVPEEVQTKIETGIKKRDEFMPSAETIMEKIEAGIEDVKEALDD